MERRPVVSRYRTAGGYSPEPFGPEVQTGLGEGSSPMGNLTRVKLHAGVE
jgi:hypothetical protein